MPALLLLAAVTSRVGAQLPGTAPLVMLSSDAEERLRLDQLTGHTGAAGFLIRSPSRLTPAPLASPADTGSRSMLQLLMPDVRTVSNSALPFGGNDGPLWAGRGLGVAATAGAVLVQHGIRVIVAPTLVYEQNRGFQVIPYPRNAVPPRNQWANPFHPLPESIDLPLRFGDQASLRVDAGQSSLTANLRNVALGAATENLWWGPGIQNAIVLSNNAGGFPHLFVQTRQPLRTSAGTFDAQWILGQLSESGFFDYKSDNNKRSLSGAIVTWTPAGDTALTVGMSRMVIGNRSGSLFPFTAALDVLRSAGHANSDSTETPTGRDQITSFFARWLLPAAGVEAYAEWARFEEPTSLRDFLESPAHSEGYTVGLQWARPLRRGRTFRLQSELSYLEPDPSLRVRPVLTTYTSRGVPQGFTNRGQALGAFIGPGSSSQWFAGDLFSSSWRLGLYAERIRWDNGVLFEPIVPQFKRQDVSLLAGTRASVSWRGVNLAVDFAHAARFDYLFQAFALDAPKTGGIDLLNNTVSVTLSTALPHR